MRACDGTLLALALQEVGLSKTNQGSVIFVILV